MNFDAVKTRATNALCGVPEFFHRVINFLMGHWPRNITVLFRGRRRGGERCLTFEAVGISRSACVI